MKFSFEITDEEIKSAIIKYVRECAMNNLVDCDYDSVETWVRNVFKKEFKERVKQEVRDMESEALQEAITKEIQSRFEDMIKISLKNILS